MKVFRFTLMETIVAIFILVVCIDLIFDFFMASRKNQRSHQDAFVVSLVLDSTLSQLDPNSYTSEELNSIIRLEAKNNTLSERGISYLVFNRNGVAEIKFLRRDKVIYETELLLP